MRRALVALAAVLLLTTPASAAESQLQQPYVVAWWSATQVTPLLPGLVSPDVGPQDLYVAGVNALPLALPVLGPVGPVAIAGLRFQLPRGSAAKQLTVRLRSPAPPAVSFTACRALRPFTRVHGGTWADLPPHDCTDAGLARITPTGEVVVEGIDRLRRGRALDILLVPGPLDRLVVAGGSLAVTRPHHSTSTPPVIPHGAAPAPPPADAPPAPSGGPALGGPLAPAPTAAGPAAPVTPAPALASPTARAAAVERPWLALLVTLLVAMAVFAALLRPSSREPAGPVGVRGVGRLRSERSGSVPDLM